MFLLDIGHFLPDVVEDVRGHLLHPEVVSLLGLRVTRRFEIVLVELGRRGRYDSVPLVRPLGGLAKALLQARAEDDAFAHELDDGHQLKKNLHEAHSKLRYLHKLAGVLYLFVRCSVPMSRTS